MSRVIAMASALAFIVLAAVTRTTATATTATWPTPSIAWWYACDGNSELELAQIVPHAHLVTSVQTYCGWTVADNGTVVNTDERERKCCQSFFPALTKLGVRAELVLNGGNCSIASYRKLWGAPNTAGQLLAIALEANASGWNIDLEPQSVGGSPPRPCGGLPTGTRADATTFAAWLAAVRGVLQRQGIRLTAAVAEWSPVLGAFATLAPSVDRLQNMGLYNLGGPLQWHVRFAHFLASGAPRAKLAPGLGCWDVGDGAWWETAAGAAYKVNQSKAARVAELAMFRLYPNANASLQWPFPHWWRALEGFVQNGKPSAAPASAGPLPARRVDPLMVRAGQASVTALSQSVSGVGWR